MNMRATLLLSVTGFCLGAGLGSFSGDRSRAGGRQSVSDANDTPPAAESAPAASAQVVAEKSARLLSILQTPDSLRRRHQLFLAMRELGPAELAALVQHAEGMPPHFRNPLLAALLERWLEVDIPGARKWLTTHNPERETLLAWSRVDPDAALADAVSGRAPNWTIELVVQASRGDDTESLREGILRLARLPASSIRDAALLGQRAKFDLSSYPKLFSLLVAADPAGAFELAASLPEELRDRARESAMSAWVAKDPEAAMRSIRALLPELHSGLSGNPILGNASFYLAKKDPASAIRFVYSLPAEHRAEPLQMALRVWAEASPVEALRWCAENGVSLTQSSYNQTAVLAVALKHDPEKAAAWLRSLPPGAERESAMESGLVSLLGQNAFSRTAFTTRGGPMLDLFAQLPPEAQERHARSLAASLVSEARIHDVSQLLAYFPEGAAHDEALTGAFAALYDSANERAESALSDLVSQPQRDAALAGIVSAMDRKTPALAAERALEIQDPRTRLHTLDLVMPRWLKTDPDAARAWLSTAPPVPPEWLEAWTRN